MNRIRRTSRRLARLAGSPGLPGGQASRRKGARARPAGRGARDGFAGRFIQDVAAAASAAVGHQADRAGHPGQPAGRVERWPVRASDALSAEPADRIRPAAAMRMSRRRAMIAPGLSPRTIQLCVHCQMSPAGFWVSRKHDQTVRRPWCLSCCQVLDRGGCDVIPFDS